MKRYYYLLIILIAVLGLYFNTGYYLNTAVSLKYEVDHPRITGGSEDIIAQKEKDTLVVVEVKTRNSAVFGDPHSFVSKKKVQQIVKAADEYVVSNQLYVEVRFDIIAILKNKNQEELEHIENAFYHF